MDTKTSNDSTKRFQRIFGNLEPWEFWMSREIAVEFRRRADGKRLGEPVIPDTTGAFVIDLEFMCKVTPIVKTTDRQS
jgi:hypothetical protein